MTRVIFIAYYFPPSGGAGVQRAQKFVQYLPARGYLPVVITGPTSPEGRWTPQDRTLLNAIPSEVTVHRVGGSLPANHGRVRSRLNRWLRLPDAFSRWWVNSAVNLALEVVNSETLIFATMSPFESGEVAARLSLKLGIPWIADLRDPWALDEMQVYPSLLHRRLEMRRMYQTLSKAKAIVMNCPEASANLRAAFPELRAKPIFTITNGFDKWDFESPLDTRSDGKFRIVHTGYLHTDAGFELRSRRIYRLLGGAINNVDILTRSHTVLIAAVERLCAERPEVRGDLELVFAGKTSHEDKAVANDSRVADLIRFPGYLSHDESLRMVRGADALFLPMHSLPQGTRARIVPGKTYEYMASGRPILAAVPDGDARDFLEQCGTAICCRPDDVADITRALDTLYSAWKAGDPQPSSNTRFTQQFDRRNLTERLADVFDQFTNEKARTPSNYADTVLK